VSVCRCTCSKLMRFDIWLWMPLGALCACMLMCVCDAQANALRVGSGSLTCLYLSGNSIGGAGIQELAGISLSARVSPSRFPSLQSKRSAASIIYFRMYPDKTAATVNYTTHTH
jgi:hypothetical protein